MHFYCCIAALPRCDCVVHATHLERFRWIAPCRVDRCTARLYSNRLKFKITVRNLPSAQEGQGAMDELIGRIVAAVGIERTVAEKSVGIILDFLSKEGPADKVQALIDRLPGAQELVQAAQAEGGGLGGMMGGIMGVGTRLMGIGLGMGEIQSVTREIIAYAREKVGEDAVGEIVAAIPGLSQFV
jgi:hypothetical protein